MKYFILSLAVAAGLLAGSPKAQASSLSPGSSTAPGTYTLPSGTTVASGSQMVNLNDIVNETGWKATLTYAVYKESGGAYDFLYQIKNDSSSFDTLDRLSNTSFKGFTTNVFYLNSTTNLPSGFVAGTAAPSDATRSNGKGSTVGFDFSLDPGQTSRVLVIQVTDAGGFKAGTSNLSNSVAHQFSTFAPTPEPASLVLLGGCFVGLAGACGWRRFRKVQPA
jgi:hypothetical protein